MSIQSINTTDELFGWTALEYAFASRYNETARIIVKAGATSNEHVLLQ